jgi:hypothetical protein
LALVLAAAVLAPSGAFGDADPASDVLLDASVFYPYTPTVQAPIQNALNAETAAAARADFPVKVAIIASPVDLGGIPDLYAKPQQYAEFLDEELSFQSSPPLLVVMANGYGAQRLGPGATRRLSTLAKPTSGQSDALARAALAAVPEIAAAAGHPIAALRVQARSSSAGLGTGAWLAVVAVAVLLVVAGIGLRRRARPKVTPLV